MKESETLRSNRVQLGLPSLLDPGSETHIKIISAWIKRCDKAPHSKASQNKDEDAFIPTRLLDVGDTQSTRVSLKCRFEEKSVLYVALSHRWGPPGLKTPAEVKFHETNRDSIKTIIQGIEDTDLPKTFHDAVVVTRKLGVKYLWIDSLCILQKVIINGAGDSDKESKQDWNNESKLMEKVFSSAYFTIAASCAENRFTGFLKPRPARQFISMKANDGAQFYLCDAIDRFDADVEQGELNKRGWVLQERALSRRTIHFTKTQTYWECGEGVWCETFTKTTNQRSSFLGDSNFPDSFSAEKGGMQLQLYQSLYEKYSSLGLSFDTDRPRAIAGLEARLKNTLKSKGGYGVFHKFFERGLLWQRASRSEAPLKPIKFESEDKPPPSWSWVAWKGEIRYMNVPLGRVTKATNIVSPFEESGPAILPDTAVLRAPLRALAVNTSAPLILDDPSIEEPRPNECVVVAWDQEKDENGRQRHYVLLVSRIEEKVYRRVGVAYLDAADLRAETEYLVQIR